MEKELWQLLWHCHSSPKNCGNGEKCTNLRISKGMDYSYRIQSAVQRGTGELMGLRVMVCNEDNFGTVDIPASVLSHETRKYLEFRLSIPMSPIYLPYLPRVVQERMRAPIGRWLDRWVQENFYGDISDGKGSYP